MKKSARSFTAFDRRTLLLLGTALGLTICGVVAWHSSAEGNAGKDAPATQNERPAITGQCTMDLFTPLAPMPTPRQGHFALTAGTSIYVGGGADSNGQSLNILNRYDPATGLWNPLASLPTGVYGASAVFVPNLNSIYVFGGLDGSGTTDRVQVYNIPTNVWSAGVPMPAARQNTVAGLVDGDNIIVAGGNDQVQVQPTTWSYHPSIGQWIPLAPIPGGGVYGADSAVFNGRFDLLGGVTNANVATNQVWEFYNGSWTAKPNMAAAHAFTVHEGFRYEFSAHTEFNETTIPSGFIFEIGGGNAGNPSAAGRSTEIYNVNTGTSTNGTDLMVGRNRAAGAAIGNDLYVFGGVNGTTLASAEKTTVHCPAQTAAVTDFDGDGKSDLGIFRPGPAEWYYQQSSTGLTRGFQFGTSTDKPVPGDFTGDGKADIAFWRPSTGEWFVLRSENSTYFAFPFGSTNDIPRPADYDGDSIADPAVYRPSISTWFILRSTGGVASVPFGISSDVPVPADYDGDGSADIAIWRSGPGQWWVLRSSNQTVFAATFGNSADKPVPGDYTGDGKADIAFYRPSEGSWYVLRSENSSYYAFPFGISTDKPVPADYDGDGKFDPAVFRPSDRNWYILRSRDGLYIQQYGLTNDIPLPGAFIP